MNRKKKSLIHTIASRINVIKDPLNTPQEFWGPWGHILDVMPVVMHLQLPQNNWKDVYRVLLWHINIKKKIYLFKKKNPRLGTDMQT